MRNAVNLIFPHQLFLNSPLFKNDFEVYLIEEHLFFKHYQFHKQKIAFHRASMKSYQEFLISQGRKVHYISADHVLADIRNFQQEMISKEIKEIHVVDPTDEWLQNRLNGLKQSCDLITYQNPQFFNSIEDLSVFFRKDKKSFFQTSFYKQQRLKRGILVDENNQPDGGQWTFDVENRKKFPKNKIPPTIHFPEPSDFWDEAVAYTKTHFGENPGELSSQRIYPIDHQESSDWLEQFFTYRFYDFGAYEDAIVKDHVFLNHSILSPLMNAGLILPCEVIEKTLHFAAEEKIPINSTEGFVRQIIGWREFIRGMYWSKGNFSRTQNYWNFKRKIPQSFYTGTTGIDPVDDAIKKVLKTGYCHHIERLMVLGNFMFLCEFDPDEVYRWFMELFIDAYDWVMVPNVYGMSQFADGGTFATKPYIGGSNYIKKMSDYSKGAWEPIWDGLFWRFIHNQEGFFLKNPRTSMMVHSFRKMSDEKKNGHLVQAEQFLKQLA